MARVIKKEAPQHHLLSDVAFMKQHLVTSSSEIFLRAHSSKFSPLRELDLLKPVGGSGRFCCPVYPAEYVMTYAAKSAEAALVESRKIVPQESPESTSGPATINLVISGADFEDTRLSTLRTTKKLVLLPLEKFVPIVFGLVDDVNAISYANTQKFALMVKQLAPYVDGIVYPSRLFHGEFCTALFDHGINRAGIVVAQTITLQDSASLMASFEAYKVIVLKE